MSVDYSWLDKDKPCVFGDTYDAGGRCCETHHLLTDCEVACERAEIIKVKRMMEAAQ